MLNYQVAHNGKVTFPAPTPPRIGVLEDAEDYNTLEVAIIGGYDAQSAVERELVLRLASVLWRLRRATTMETGLFEIQAHYMREFRQDHQVNPASREVVYALFGRGDTVSFDPTSHGIMNGTEAVGNSRLKSIEPAVDPTADLARCFLRLATLPNFALDRLSRYEATLSGAKSVRSCLLSDASDVANHKREGAVWPTDATTIELRGSTHLRGSRSASEAIARFSRSSVVACVPISRIISGGISGRAHVSPS